MFFSSSFRRNRRTVFLNILWSFLFAFLFFSCSHKQGSSQKMILRMAFFSDPQTLDPRKNRDISSSMAQNMIFEGLTRLSENGHVEWAQAEKVTISEDGLVYYFYLRDAYWTDGHPVTADDFEYAWKKCLDPSFVSSSSFLLSPILNASAILRKELSTEKLGVRAIDKKTLEVKLSNPTPYFLSLVSFCTFFPIPKHIETLNPGWAVHFECDNFISNGPFKLSQWKKNELFAVQKNLSYWDADHVHLHGIHVNIIADEKTCLQMFETKEIDYLNTCFIPISLDSLEVFKKKDCLRINPVGGTVFCSFNLTQIFLKNKKIRKALSLAIDRQSIVANISQMDEIPATRLIPPILSSNPELCLLELFNPSLALVLFQEGLAELNTTVDQFKEQFILSYENSEKNRRIAQTIQQQWKQILGIEVKLAGTEDYIHLEKLEHRDYSIALDYWAAHYMDPSCILNRFKDSQSKKNYPGYENAEYIAILNRAEQTPDISFRNQLLEQAEEIISSDLPIAPIFHFNVVTLQSDRFETIEVTPLGGPILKKIRPTR